VLDFRQLRYFICLYEEGSVTRAARRVHIVQPALSAQIAKLEDELGYPLFTRTPKGMVPTAAARKLYADFLPVHNEFNRVSQQALGGKGELVGDVRFGAVATIAQGIMGEVLADFLELHPRVSLSVVEGYSASLVDQVVTGRLDAAIVNQSGSLGALSTTPVVEEPFQFVTSPRERRLPDAVPFRSLANFRLVLPSRSHGLRIILENILAAEGLELVPVMELDSVPVILQLVQRGGISTVLPRLAILRAVESGEVRAHTIASPSFMRNAVCVMRTGPAPSPAAAAFVEFAMHRVRAAAGLERS
jgi:LysR family nitrogen assimilation transcriptional regulator